jgi:hypothetical protein
MSFSSIVMLIFQISNNLSSFEPLPTSDISNELFISYESIGLLTFVVAILLGVTLKFIHRK